jgi:UDP-N-acetylglucosamine--N-acetylmuramyl-(pentapeptide) pyrophosphoryl-undecaprenol N-acetylglucosamine transferase
MVLITSNRQVDFDLTKDVDARILRLAGTGLGKGISGLVAAISSNLAALAESVSSLYELPRPGVVVLFGGYHSPLVALVAKSRGASVVVVEQNAVFGRANRMVAAIADRIAIAWPMRLSGRLATKTVITGNPLRESMLGSLEEREPDRPPKIVVTSGSLGSERLNSFISALAPRICEMGIELWHFTGSRNRGQSPVLTAPGYHRLDYTPELPRLMSGADLVVSRAGASTLAEIAALGKPSVLIPLPGSPNNHQVANAKVFANTGAAVMVEESDLESEAFIGLVSGLLADRSRLKLMGEAARSLARPHAAKAVAWEVLSCLYR